ncbi:hypothetical protein A3Q56_03832 [Intoshia linei]|uniref:G-patch domain-containing protein n=1 Tax=Intoshia linei TaxID=1819745 RepID=A0A177B4B5_9BILA|nr:hypothetical protein A3Q56_03832 [Intoshia linei]
MLAEKKSKKMYSNDPNGLKWRKDNIGKDLLKKMGWKEGLKLGKNENGLAEPIIPKLKTVEVGLGFDEHDDTDILEERNKNYNEALNKLNIKYQQNFKIKTKPARKIFKKTKNKASKEIQSKSKKEISCILGKNYIPQQINN